MTAQITAGAVKALREETGAGIMDCKRALEQAGGDAEQAKTILREQGLAARGQEGRAGRPTRGSSSPTSTASGGVGRIGALVEINCETDFVARTDEFKQLAREVALQVVAMNPRFITSGGGPA